MKLQSGQVLSGTLRLVRRLADGGMGSVWIAEHLVLGTEVAVKVMARPWADMPGAPTRFLREARITAAIDSPHVVRVLDCRLTEADEPYLVLELLRGETLEERVRRHGPLPVGELLAVLRQTAEALRAAHAASILHRDLKPENVFLVAGPATFVKLLDFGVAKPKDPAAWLDADRLPAGTPQYMSPEQLFDAETADERADLFSLAAVAYFGLTGRAPFPGGSLEALYFAVDAGDFEAPSAMRPELSPAIDAFFSRALAHDPAARFPDARALAEALASAIAAGRAALPPAVTANEDDDDASPESGWAFHDAPLPVEVPGLRRRGVALARVASRGDTLRRYGAVSAVLALAAMLVWQNPSNALGAAGTSAPRAPDDTTEAVVPMPLPTSAAAPARPTVPTSRARLAPRGARGAARLEKASIASEEGARRIQSILADVPREVGEPARAPGNASP